MATMTPYNEDHIVERITKIFDLHRELCYFEDDDLLYPTTQVQFESSDVPRHNFPPDVRSTFASLNISPRVISLLERIPYISSASLARNMPFYHPDSQLACIYEPTADYPMCGLERARDPGGMGIDRSLSENESPYLLPSDISLVIMDNRDGRSVILNTEANTIHVYSFYTDEPIWDIPDDLSVLRRMHFEYPDQPWHYRNYEAQPAEWFLENWIEDLRRLRVIPWRDPSEQGNGKLSIRPPPAMRTCIAQDGSGKTWQEPIAYEDEDTDAIITEDLRRERDDDWETLEEKKYKALRYILRREYKWPDRFQQERWVGEYTRVWREIGERYEPLD